MATNVFTIVKSVGVWSVGTEQCSRSRTQGFDVDCVPAYDWQNLNSSAGYIKVHQVVFENNLEYVSVYLLFHSIFISLVLLYCFPTHATKPH